MEASEDSARAVAAIARIAAVPTLLKVLCEITGMRVAVVARVTNHFWTACAVKDEVHFGLQPGMQLALNTALFLDAGALRAAVVIEQGSADPRYCSDGAANLYQIESCVSVPITRANGEYFGNLCALDPGPAKVAPRILSMFEDFAALIGAQLDHQLQQEQEQRTLLDERAAGELREQFIAILGHDLCNPLHAAYASNDMLERRLTDPKSLAFLRRIKSNVRRMSALIDDVLDFARGRLGGGIGLELTDVENINTGLATVIQEIRDVQPECEIISNINVDRAVRCDLGRLQQVTSNLLSNAFTHGLPRKPVRISARADESDLVLEAWNAGEPIPAESLGKVFEPFWRHSVSASRQGLGLGLHICAQIVRAHAGRISVTSTREGGTQFTARLPLSSLHGSQSIPEMATAEAMAAQPIPHVRRSINVSALPAPQRPNHNARYLQS